MTELATSYFAAGNVIVRSNLVPVGITIGKPKWDAQYRNGERPVYLRELAPWGLLQVDDDEEFTSKYLERLDRIGADVLAERFAAVSDAHDRRGLALLCFERAGDPCHRRTFATWWVRQTGQPVPELENHA